MKLSAIFTLITVFSTATFPAHATEDDGRYRIVAPNKNKPFLIDSAMGRTWHLTKDGQWKQIEFFRDGRAPRNQIAPEKMSPPKSRGGWDSRFSSKPLSPAKSAPQTPLKIEKAR